jgi:hypothetical protein
MRIAGNSPWTLAAVAALLPEQLALIDAILPAGLTVTLGARHKPGVWTVHLIEAGDVVEHVYPVYDIPTGVATAVNRWKDAAA